MLEYKKLQKKHEEIINNNFPVLIAFNEVDYKQREELFRKQWPELRNEEIFQYFPGEFSTETGLKIRKELIKQYRKELEELFINKPEEFEKAVYYELENKEYIYNQEDSIILLALHINKDFLKENKLEKHYNKAVKRYMKYHLETC